MYILYFCELHFVFYKFLKFIPIFWNITKSQKSINPPHSAGPASAHGSSTVGLAHGHFGLAGPVNRRGRGALTLRSPRVVCTRDGAVACSPAALWWLAVSKVYPRSTSGTRGGTEQCGGQRGSLGKRVDYEG
jgi:hypothetical protein